jgi:hypothetical protein
MIFKFKGNYYEQGELISKPYAPGIPAADFIKTVRERIKAKAIKRKNNIDKRRSENKRLIRAVHGSPIFKADRL